MERRIPTRMGDGERVWLPEPDVRADILEGMMDAGRRAEIEPLTREEQDRIFDIIAEPGRMVSVHPGEEVIVIDNGYPNSAGSDPVEVRKAGNGRHRLRGRRRPAFHGLPPL